MNESVETLLASLETLSQNIRGKIELIKSGVKSTFELEVIHRETKRMLANYDSAITRCTGYTALCPDLDISSHRTTYERLFSSEHQAVISARSALTAQPSARSQLVRRIAAPVQPADSLAQDITDSLCTLTQTMQDELLRSEASFEIMARSTKRMQATAETYTVFGGVLTTSKRMIANLWRREKTDRMLIMAAVGMYSLVLLYIAGKRLWFPRFIFPWIYRCVAFVFRLVYPHREPIHVTVDTAVSTLASSNVVEPINVSLDAAVSALASSNVVESIISATQDSLLLDPTPTTSTQDAVEQPTKADSYQEL
ncbi:hypothetical protein PSACC_00757 [Paramicrosporidium saccamoebae]|uniref:Sec20 C-terminal domain-containing protein n=1 Tax=Paramicrosporidium saccamoebae TaxID=1246581 RepID=A0A2H9TNS4_9FUNG|nr:hypothetical protein PSACC_00757 [Paramicrosporidium saccamoebae]